MHSHRIKDKERRMKKGFLCAAFILCFMAPLAAGAEKSAHQEGEGIAVPDVKKQFFCGYCHVLSYPNVIKKAYLSWKEGKHKDTSCVQCHYPPEELKYKIPGHRKIPKDEKAASEQSAMEFMKTELEVLSRLITVLNMDSSVVRTKPILDDRSCTTSACHPKTGKGKEGEYWTKKIQVAEYARPDTSKGTVSFTHEKHFEKEKWVEGQEMHCTTCHARETEGKHFEVSRQKCFLCHFKNLALNEERAKCSLCHTVPEKPLQTQKTEDNPDEKPVTHKSLQEAKVPCESCHRQLVQGMGLVKAERCITCHDKSEDLEKGAVNKKLMHKKHVAEQAAHCFNCHESIAHKEADFIDIARSECSACHPNHHKYQKLLLAGKEFKDVPETPSLMFRVKTNCLACHQGNKTVRGEAVSHGSGKACASCHTEKHEGMAKEWKDKTDEELKAAREMEKEALDAIENAKGKATENALKEASESVKKGQEYMNFVEYGGGVHNKKYSIMLLDKAMSKFEDAIDQLSKEK
ncbi:MAG: ammonia-forming cytochrome c nitrite reductase subunit c552 [Nitrospiraceae bacterium]|nr:MAG: ammonia-forming cytochrome c nitrite reductase subunit c552 [Nitrospiraceae bacterium]